MWFIILIAVIAAFMTALLTPRMVANNRRDVPVVIRTSGFGLAIMLSVVATQQPAGYKLFFFSLAAAFFLLGLGAWVGLRRCTK